jgi:hypothetical protein
LRGWEVPVDEGVAAGRGSLRASHADRERVIDTLKTAFTEGRLDKGELDDRVGQTLAARTYAELAAVTADIRARPAPPSRRGAQPVVNAGRPMVKAGQPPVEADQPPVEAGRPVVDKETVKWGLVGAGAVIPPAMFVTALYVWPFPLAFVAMPLLFIELIVVIVFVITVLAKQHRDRPGAPRSQLPPQPDGGEAERPGCTGHEPSPHRTRTDLPVRKTRPDRDGPGVPVSGGARLGPRAAWGTAASP